MTSLKRYPVVVLERIVVEDYLKPDRRPQKKSTKVGPTISEVNVKKELTPATGTERRAEVQTSRTPHDVKSQMGDVSSGDSCSSSISCVLDLVEVKKEEPSEATPESVSFQSEHSVSDNQTPSGETLRENSENEGSSGSSYCDEPNFSVGDKFVFSPAPESSWNNFQPLSEGHSNSGSTEPSNSSLLFEILPPGRPEVHSDQDTFNCGESVIINVKSLAGCVQSIATKEVSTPEECLNAQISDSKLHECNLCLKSFKRRNKLKSHLAAVHKPREPFKCHSYPVTYKQKLQLNTHLRSLTGEKAFKCEQCGETFSLRAALTSHLAAHSNDERFKCDVCCKEFNVLENFKAHMATHEQVKPPKYTLKVVSDEKLFHQKKPLVAIECNGITDENNSNYGNQFKVCLDSSSTKSVGDNSSKLENPCSKSLENFEKANSNEGFCSEEGNERLAGIPPESGWSFPAHSVGKNQNPQHFMTHKNINNEIHKNQLSFLDNNAINVPIDDKLITSSAFDRSSVSFASNEFIESDCLSSSSPKIPPDDKLITDDAFKESSICFDEPSDFPVGDNLTGDVFEESKVFFYNNASSLPLIANVMESDPLEVLPNLSKVKSEVCDIGISGSPDSSNMLEDVSSKESDRLEDSHLKNGACSFTQVLNEPQKSIECLPMNQKAEIFSQSSTSAVTSGGESSGSPPAYNKSSAESTKVLRSPSGREALNRDADETPLEYRNYPLKCSTTSELNCHIKVPSYVEPQCDLCLEKFGCGEELNKHLKQVHGSENPFKCDHCDAAFKDRDALKNHLTLHNGGRLYECNSCSAKFQSQSILQSHLKMHDEKVFQCAHCLVEYTRKTNLLSHLEAHYKGNPQRCSQCSIEFTDGFQAMVHFREHAQDKPFKCDRCPERYSKPWLLKKHSISHDGEPLQCDLCLQRFACGDKLSGHLKLVHGNENPFKCDECNEAFKNRDSLQNHMVKHSDGGPHKCNSCGAKFQFRSLLQSHLKIHSSEKVFCCDECPGKFSSMSHLLEHVIVHCSEDSLKCTRCAAKFKDRSNLVAHFRNHWVDKPFRCDLCPRSFKHQQHLKTHAIIHSTDKPHQCEKCPKRFQRAYQLKAHARIHNDERPFMCHLCSATFKTDSHRKEHLKAHSDGGQFICYTCGGKFKSKSVWSVHARKHCRSRQAEPSVDRQSVSSENLCESQSSGFEHNVINVPIGESITDTLDESSVSFDNVLRNSVNVALNCSDINQPSIFRNTNVPNVPADDISTPSDAFDGSSVYFEDSRSSVSVVDNLTTVDPLQVSPDLAQVEAEKCNDQINTHTADVYGRFEDKALKKPGRLLKVHFSKGTCSVTNLQKDIPLECLPKNHGTEKFGSDRIFLWNSDSTSVGIESRERSPACNPLSDETKMAAFVSSLKDVLSVEEDDKSPEYKSPTKLDVSSEVNYQTKAPSLEERYQCYPCVEIFTCSDDLVGHLKQVHGSENLLKCDHCNAVFKDCETLKDHLTEHNNGKPCECNACGAKFPSRSVLQGHLKIHSSEEVFRCEQCSTEYRGKSDLVAHLNTHHPDPLKCDSCTAEFKDRVSLICHRKKCGEKPFKCNQCPKSYHHKTHLGRHLLIHSRGKPHGCKHCPKRFARLDHLKQHAKRHSGKRPSKRDLCSATFKTTSTRINRMELRNDERLYECNECGTNFKNKRRLRHHLKSHDNEADFPCKYCSAKFRRKADLTDHLWSHSDGKPFKCRQCSASFRTASSFSDHRKVHSIEVGFDRNQCPKNSNTEGNLNEHVFSHSQGGPFEGSTSVDCNVGLIEHQKRPTEIENITLDDESDEEPTICFDSTQRSSVGNMSTSTDVLACDDSSVSFDDSQSVVFVGDDLTASDRLEVSPVLSHIESEVCGNVTDTQPIDVSSSFEGNSLEHPGRSFEGHYPKGMVTNLEAEKNIPPECLPSYEKEISSSTSVIESGVESSRRPFSFNTLSDETNAAFISSFRDSKVDQLENQLQCRQAMVNSEMNSHINVSSFEESYQCDLCLERFAYVDEFNCHLKQVHGSENPFKCDYCVAAFKDRDALKNHLTMHKSYTCTTCGAKFRSQSTLQSHLKIHNSEEVFRCENCSTEYSRKSKLIAHLKAYHPPNLLKCSLCTVAFRDRFSLIAHENDCDKSLTKRNQCPEGYYNKAQWNRYSTDHSNEKPFKCNHCPRGYYNEMNLKRHLKSHSSKERHQCKHCSKIFTHSDQLKEHARSHIDEKHFKCDHCPATFDDKDTRNKHVKIMHSGRSYECDECGVNFKTKMALRDHLKSHNGETDFRCKPCSIKFSQRSDFTAHLQLHKHGQLFECHHCAAGFRTASAMRNHELTHNSSKERFECDRCSRKFRTKGFLMKHMFLDNCKELSKDSSSVHSDVRLFEGKKPQLLTEKENITLGDHSDDELMICFDSTQKNPTGDELSRSNILAEAQTLLKNRLKVYSCAKRK